MNKKELESDLIISKFLDLKACFNYIILNYQKEIQDSRFDTEYKVIEFGKLNSIVIWLTVNKLLDDKDKIYKIFRNKI